MVFLGIYRAIYDYAPQGQGELEIKENDLLFVLEKSIEDDWWKAKKKAQDEDEEEPEGLIPNNYVEEATPSGKAKALYDYTRQTDEELSFTEDTLLDVYDTSDPDWTLVGLNGEYGFAPANYIEAADAGAEAPEAPAAPAPPSLPARASVASPQPDYDDSPTPESPSSPARESPAAALAGILAQKSGSASASAPRAMVSPPPQPTRHVQFTPEASDEEPPTPSLPQRPPSVAVSSPTATQYASRRESEPPGIMPSPPIRQSTRGFDEDSRDHGLHSPVGFHLYNIHEMVSHMGKNKKMPMTLGINIPRGLIMISPEKSRDGPQQEWTADKLTHYSIEGKHVFMELVRPSKSIDFHAGAKDTAMEITSALGELAGAARAGGLREVIAAGSGSSNVQKNGTMLYDFEAQGDDEVTVAKGDEVTVIDDSKSEEWWMVRRLKNGKEGVVPSSYVEITSTTALAPPSSTGINAGRSHIDQARLEEERLARHASKANGRREGSGHAAERSKRDTRDGKAPSTSKPRPDLAKVRTWTDRSGSFKVEAEFIGLKDNKIHLHKLNGVKIAVPVPKMSIEDLEFVERATGVSLDEDKPLSDIKRKTTQRRKEEEKKREKSGASGPRPGISVEQPKKPEYDWFDFFLGCGVNPQICERYANAFNRDQMTEEVLPDITESTLRTLGLKEGDILRVMKFLDNKYGRTTAKQQRNVSFGGATDIPDGEEGANGSAGGLFSGPGGTLRNNTRKGRPAPPVQTNDIVDAKAFEQKADQETKRSMPQEATATPLATAPAPGKKTPASGFDDDAWDVKPSKQPPSASTAPPASTPAPTSAPAPAAPPPPPTLTGGLAELSLLSSPLQPTPAPQPAPQPQAQAPPVQPQQIQPTGATPSLFDQLANAPPAPQPQIPQPQIQQPTGFQQQASAPRQRPQAPQQAGNTASLIAPPPQRASSAPQNPQQSAFGPPPPLQPQLTGYQNPGFIQAQPAPPGQSLQDLQRQQTQGFGQQPLQAQPAGFGQQNFNQFQNGFIPQPTGMGQQLSPQQQLQPQQTGFGQFQPQQTGFGQPPLPQQQAFMNTQAGAGPFADPGQRPQFAPIISQPTGQPVFGQPGPLQVQATGVNAFLPPALQPQRTGAPPTSFGGSPPPVPPIPQGPTIAPLQPQKTGPAPPVRFGVTPSANKLVPQPTGRRANLSQATPQNPFGF